MPKRRKKGGTKNSKGLILKRNTSISRDTTKCIASPINVSLEQSISSGYDVIWNDRSPVTTGQQPIIGQSLMKTLQGKEGLVQKKEGHQLLELFKSNMKSIQHHHTNDSEVQVKRSRRQQLEISKAQNELKQLAKRLQYYNEDEMEEDESVKQHHHFHNNTGHNRLLGDVQVTSSMTSSVTIVTNTCTNTTQCSDAAVMSCNNITTTAKGGGVKTQCGNSGVVESDTDTMSCYDDDSSPDQYQPIGSHHCVGVADKNKTVTTTQDGCVAKIRPLQSINSNSNNFPSDDDPELDRIFASVEMTTNDCYNDTADDEQFWSTAAIELSHQEVGLMHSTPCRPPAPPTVTNSNNSSGADFVDMILTYNDDIDLILNQN